MRTIWFIYELLKLTYTTFTIEKKTFTHSSKNPLRPALRIQWYTQLTFGGLKLSSGKQKYMQASNGQGTFRGHKFYEENNTEHLRMVGEERDTHTGGQGKGQRRKHLRRARSRQPPPRPVPVRTSAETWRGSGRAAPGAEGRPGRMGAAGSQKAGEGWKGQTTEGLWVTATSLVLRATAALEGFLKREWSDLGSLVKKEMWHTHAHTHTHTQEGRGPRGATAGWGCRGDEPRAPRRLADWGCSPSASVGPGPSSMLGLDSGLPTCESPNLCCSVTAALGGDTGFRARMGSMICFWAPGVAEAGQPPPRRSVVYMRPRLASRLILEAPFLAGCEAASCYESCRHGNCKKFNSNNRHEWRSRCFVR